MNNKQGAAKSYGTVLAELDEFLGQLNKSASVGDGTPDGTVAVPEGARSKENTKDVKETVPGVPVDASAESANKESPVVDLTTAATTGKDVPGTKPVPAESTAKPGNAETEKGAEFLVQVKEACAKHGAEAVVTEIGNSLMADIAVMTQGEKQASAPEAAQAAKAGEMSADAMIKQAMAEALPEITQYIEKQAEEAATALHDYYAGLQSSTKKAAEGAEGAEEAVPGEAEPGAAGAEGALPEADLAQLAAAAQGGPADEGAPVEGPPPGAALEGAPEGAGAPGDQEVIEALSEALADAGVTPEELAQAVEAQGAGPGPGAGGPPGAGPEPKMASLAQRKQASDIAKTAMCEVNRHRNMKAVGRLQVKKASLSLAWQMRQMVKEVTGK